MPYSTITDAEIDPDSPLTSGLCVKFRDNPIAIAQAGAGAPKIVLNALNNSFIFFGSSASAAVTIPAFATTPTGGMVIFVLVTVSDSSEFQNGAIQALLDGAFNFQATKPFGASAISTTNAQHTISFSAINAATFSATVVAIAS